MPISPATARLIEVAEIAFITAQIGAARHSVPAAGFLAEPVGGGVAALTKPDFGRKLNHVAGFGMNGPVTEKDIDTIERIYSAIGVPPEINLCPFADPSARELLAPRGWMVCAEMNVWSLSLHDYTGDSWPEGKEIVIGTVREEEMDQFITASTDGFRVKDQESDLPRTLAYAAYHRPDSRVYFARINGQIAGTAAMALIKTPLGRVAELYLDSTVPEFRGKGVQAALLRTRLAEAKRAGFDIAAVTTWPQGTSARNVERVGFRLAYKKDVYTPAVN
ncbi:hypothetical protein BJX61DRAFT_210540 [Aspergillus egyptiacus]|nr:hypothetical protein BJX61DRAFT_210540 [Aspergillus egyptiacus]